MLRLLQLSKARGVTRRIGYRKSKILKVELTVDGVRDLMLGCRMMCKVAHPIDTDAPKKFLDKPR